MMRHARALAHLRLAFPEKTDAEREIIARDMWENLGRTFGEGFHLKAIAESDRIVIDSWDEVRALSISGKTVVACGAHFGNWELTILGLLLPGLRPASLYRKIHNPYVDAYVTRMRAPYYPGGLLPRKPDTTKYLMRHARKGGTVAFLADLREDGGVDVPFFGVLAPSTTFPAVIARSNEVPLYAGYVVREPNVRFRLFMEEIPVDVTADRGADIRSATAALQAAFERMIRKMPEQWMWANRRWEQ